MTLEGRFWAKVEKTDSCWLWTAATVRGGYGQFRVGDKSVKAHRWAYEQLVGPIPAGLTIDHLCRVPRCVNPDHLEPVTMRVNVLRGTGPAAVNARKTHCPRGHPLTGANVKLVPTGRTCRICYVARYRQWNAAQVTGVGKGGHLAARTHCPRGHPYDEANTYRLAGRNGRTKRLCRACRRESNREAKRRIRRAARMSSVA